MLVNMEKPVVNAKSKVEQLLNETKDDMSAISDLLDRKQKGMVCIDLLSSLVELGEGR